ncbi:Arc family DNA-binding protein [Brucella sp. BO3]|uniref:Arc family DNA-binding protein n=1 Tax=Brucella sp. BO3 TaxID=2691913 RepID=UPI0009F16E6A|nr:Arc family DNA-binding protein [Brucella sp. BO3]
MALASRGSEQIALRLPLGMRDLIKAAADAEGRSVNSELVIQLRRIYCANEKSERA